MPSRSPSSAAAVAIGGAQAADAAAPGANGAIVFVSDRDSVDANGDGSFQNSERNREIYSVNPDGTGLARLTDDLDSDTRPAAAPNGRTIAFDSSRSGNDELYAMNPDGSGVSQVTDRGAPDRGPSFSADGQRLAYSVRHASTLPGGKSEGDIWTVNTDGTETTRLTFDRELDEFDPAFSPDGSRIAFVGGTPGNVGSSYDVFLVDADGANMVNLTGPNGGAGVEDADPSFSPDGSRITFMSERDGGPEIWVMDIDGSNPAAADRRLRPRRAADLLARRHQDRVHRSARGQHRSLHDERRRQPADPADRRCPAQRARRAGRVDLGHSGGRASTPTSTPGPPSSAPTRMSTSPTRARRGRP